jgi:predicted  nucleic acid-binding Zn-ribbon protein
LTDWHNLKEWEDMVDNKPMMIEDLATKVDGLAQTVDSLATKVDGMTLTVDNLAALMQAGFNALNQKIDAVQDHADTRIDQLKAHMDDQFEERTFTPEQKEDILAVVAAANQQLEESALGKENITLTRPEYNATAITADFPNRFATPAFAE